MKDPLEGFVCLFKDFEAVTLTNWTWDNGENVHWNLCKQINSSVSYLNMI